jgi:hypothetical protein
MRWKRIRLLVAIAGAGGAFALIGVAVAPHSRSNIAPSSNANANTRTCVDLARDVDPKKVPVDSGYDPEQDLVTASFAGRTYVMRPNDQVCLALAGPRAIIEDALNASRENTSVACAQVSEALKEKRTKFRGRRFDEGGARRFLDRRCGTKP